MRLRIIDAIGCALGAFDEVPSQIARRVAGLDGPGDSTIWGTEKAVSPEMATFVNGLMTRYFDFNDTYLSKEPAHPSDNLSCCIAVAEAERRTGKDLLTAALIAYEVQCRLCDAADIRHRGWDHVNYGLVSTALAASRLMGLSEGKAAHAVNIALNGHIAMRQVRAGELSMWKGASFANAARNGVFAARLAREGMTGPAPIFEGEMGFFNQVSGPFKLKVDGFGGKNGSYKVNETYIKYWPAEYHAQSAGWGALEVRRKADPDEIERVTIETHEAGYNILGKDKEKWEPRTKETADHSLPFIVGVTLLTGKLDNESYSRKNLSDRRLLSFLKKIDVKEDKNLTALYPRRGMANRITAKLRNGRKVSAEVVVPKGHPLNPMTKADVERKFLSLAGKRIGEQNTKEVLDLIWEIQESTDIGSVLEPLRIR
jgi:2-methylcitrate dehydratase